jgi:hypothetical protein
MGNGCNVVSGPKDRIFSLKKGIYFGVPPCRLVGTLKRFGGTWCLNVQGRIYLLSHYKMWLFKSYRENTLRMENTTTSKIRKNCDNSQKVILEFSFCWQTSYGIRPWILYLRAWKPVLRLKVKIHTHTHTHTHTHIHTYIYIYVCVDIIRLHIFHYCHMICICFILNLYICTSLMIWRHI